jgi:2-keto-4-pentenoate hydratase/2-oxohepta-3-ene-1,7-dioic acid hydratase in catechol pathway
METYVRFRADGYEGYGIRDGEQVYETESLFSTERGRAYGVAAIELLPAATPSKIVCVGRNYLEHAREFNNDVPAEPLIFMKPPSSLLAPGKEIVHPSISQRVDFEGELGVIIGKRARNLNESDAWDHVFGFTCVNDVTARDLQKKDGQWTRGKGFDTFCPVGPEIVRRGDIDFMGLRVQTYLNGERKQDAPVTDMIFSVPRVIAFVTRFMTLEPGDLLATGTPSGVCPMKPGDVVEVVIDGVGRLRNTIAAE